MVRQQNIDTFDSEGENGGLVIDETQAPVVRRTDADFLAGLTPFQIAWDLTGDGIPNPMGKNHWLMSTINLILRNEKYKGDALQQKTFTTDFLAKIVKKNEGEVPQYYVTGHHEPILETTVLNTESPQAQQTTLTKELEETIVLIDQLIETAKGCWARPPCPLSGGRARCRAMLSERLMRCDQKRTRERALFWQKLMPELDASSSPIKAFEALIEELIDSTLIALRRCQEE